MSVQVECWCGSFHDVSTYAHGEYETLEEARAAVKEIFGGVRETELDSLEDEEDSGVVEAYLIGEYEAMSRESVEIWLEPAYSEEITADMTDEQISALVSDCEEELNRELECTALWCLEDVTMEARQKLIDEFPAQQIETCFQLMNYECAGYVIHWDDSASLLVREPDSANPEWEYVDNPGHLDEEGYRNFILDHDEEREEIEAWKLRRMSGSASVEEDEDEEEGS